MLLRHMIGTLPSPREFGLAARCKKDCLSARANRECGRLIGCRVARVQREHAVRVWRHGRAGRQTRTGLTS